jgi:hypothetical protein
MTSFRIYNTDPLYITELSIASLTSPNIEANTISEFTLNNGVNVDGVKLKDKTMLLYDAQAIPNAISVKAPATVSSSYDFEYPVADGAGGQVIARKATGTGTEWVSVSGATSEFGDGAFRIYDSGAITHKLAFDVGAISVALRTVTMPDNDLNLSTPSFTTLGVSGISTLTGGAQLPDGSNAVPAASFTLDTDTGLFRAGSGQLAFTSNAKKAIQIEQGMMTMYTPLESSAVIQKCNKGTQAAGAIAVDRATIGGFIAGDSCVVEFKALAMNSNTPEPVSVVKVIQHVGGVIAATDLITPYIHVNWSFLIPGDGTYRMQLTGDAINTKNFNVVVKVYPIAAAAITITL